MILKNLDAMILLIVFFSGALIAVVIYNLTDIIISERVKDIATLRVNGYHRLEAYNFISRELFIMSFIGLIIGLVGTYVNRKLLFDRMKQDVLSEVDYGKNILEGGMLLYYKGSVEPITVDGVLKVPDMSGNGNHGEMVNFKSNMRNEGGKIVFDGTNNYVKAPNVLNGRSTFTIEML